MSEQTCAFSDGAEKKKILHAKSKTKHSQDYIDRIITVLYCKACVCVSQCLCLKCVRMSNKKIFMPRRQKYAELWRSRTKPVTLLGVDGHSQLTHAFNTTFGIFTCFKDVSTVQHVKKNFPYMTFKQICV